MIKSILDTAEEKLSEFEDRKYLYHKKNIVTLYGDKCYLLIVAITSQYTCIKSLCCIPKTNTMLYVTF